ncbi:MAG: phosphate/phosphite/phosphonate ABC transporter substrate-binding protein [Deltaproteobacteria bacterium]|nr:phosphate/phosphite/phosphonate ABC transporter substrate-binding protein [Deltaproteobacteria bacterium]
MAIRSRQKLLKAYLYIPVCCIVAVLAPTVVHAEARTSVSAVKAVDRNGEFLIGLIPEQNIFKQMERYKPIANYLSKKTDLKIRLTILPRYGNIINNFTSMGMDAAFFGSFTYAIAHKKLGVDVLARPLSMNGTSTYHGLIFVRRDSGITSIAEMQGKRFAFVDKATTAGYLLPLAYFKRHGKNYRTYMKESYFTGTHEDAIYDVLNHKADIGAAKNTVYERLAAVDGRIKTELAVLVQSPDVPENGLAVKKNLAADLKRKLKQTLLDMHRNPEGAYLLKDFGAQQFIETKDSDYLPVYTYANEIGLSLATYDYMNE